jgi:hypothetical protein
MATLGLYVFSSQTTTADILISERIYAFRLVILVISGVTLLSAVLVWIFVPKSTIRLKDESLSFNNVKQILAKPSVWLLSVIIVCAYVGYKITDDFSLYAKEVMGYSEVKAVGGRNICLMDEGFYSFYCRYNSRQTENCACDKCLFYSFLYWGAFYWQLVCYNPT